MLLYFKVATVAIYLTGLSVVATRGLVALYRIRCWKKGRIPKRFNWVP